MADFEQFKVESYAVAKFLKEVGYLWPIDERVRSKASFDDPFLSEELYVLDTKIGDFIKIAVCASPIEFKLIILEDDQGKVGHSVEIFSQAWRAFLTKQYRTKYFAFLNDFTEKAIKDLTSRKTKIIKTREKKNQCYEYAAIKAGMKASVVHERLIKNTEKDVVDIEKIDKRIAEYEDMITKSRYILTRLKNRKSVLELN